MPLSEPTDRQPDPLVSVILTSHNYEKYVGEAIASVLDQSKPPAEIVVVDDGSDDGSADVVHGFGRLVTYVAQRNAGASSARNRGVSESSGALLAFLDADDLYLSLKLEIQSRVLEQDASIDVVFAHWREFHSPDVTDDRRQRLRPPVERSGAPMAAAMLIRRAAFERVGDFDPTLELGIDVDWGTRMRGQDLTSVVLDDIVYERRLHADNSWTRSADARRDLLRVVRSRHDRRRGR